MGDATGLPGPVGSQPDMGSQVPGGLQVRHGQVCTSLSMLLVDIRK